MRVLLPLALDLAYDYRTPPEAVLPPGQFVEVPLGTKRRIGVVWDPAPQEAAVDEAKLRNVARVLDLPRLPDSTRRFIDWVARYTMAPLGSVLRMAIATPSLFQPSRPVITYAWSGREPERQTAARARVIDVLRDGPPRGAADLAEAAAVSDGVVRGLAEQGVLEAIENDPDAGFLEPPPDPDTPGPVLSADQREAAGRLSGKIGDGFAALVLEGVTGSGKTEVYFEAIATALRSASGAQVLVLVPEIALTNQLLDRFEARFGARPMSWHSELTGRARRAAWIGAATGGARVVVGARSALFLPFRDLALIVVDEEHDPAYKQEEQVIYHARDMAVVRASLSACPIILVSATPSLETMVNCWSGKYERVMLPQRHGGASLPAIEAVDMRRQSTPRGRWISPRLEEALRANVEAGEQSLLFLNRRGYAPAAICRACGNRVQRDNCSAPLVVHRYGNRLQCHHCDFTMPMPKKCPKCGAEDTIIPYGPGVERLGEEVEALFPGLRVAVMASDTVRSAREAQDFIERIEKHQLDIVIGTQLVTKGHHFPMLTLVGIVDADLGLSGGDLRAGERTYQQLWQVAGRAGRAERPGRVLVQTYMPEHPVMQALIGGDGPAFYRNEAAEREEAGWPPYGRLAALILSGVDEGEVLAHARALAARAPRGPDISVLGPAPAPYARLRGRFRHRFLVRAKRGVDIQGLVRGWLAQVPERRSVRTAIDIDPHSFL
ncbi:primosomal protein N' [Iodidimonas sp. SYSU 1G8]|uniref:primosomal protein N' n=1 Tax=Iodidimonas sp. SYSU 1G8 TaxID=3133967 RepID=UPI0031FEEE47